MTGLSADIRRVARVIAVVPKTEAAGSIDQNVDLVAQDKQWQNVDTVEIQPSRVQVHIGLRLAETTKSVLLSADVKGKPAPGFVVTNYAFRPVALTVVGTEDVLRAISSLTVPVNIDTRANHAVTLTVHPILPAGATLQNPRRRDCSDRGGNKIYRGIGARRSHAGCRDFGFARARRDNRPPPRRRGATKCSQQ